MKLILVLNCTTKEVIYKTYVKNVKTNVEYIQKNIIPKDADYMIIIVDEHLNYYFIH